ncbi:hypothetical protein [Streptomyces sp. NPDC056049]|uniref:hypothetical protein n=1 Tax=Streptomyces sp. NPDC056049 TaxID=3345693 RepID=UPI0035D9D2D5
MTTSPTRIRLAIALLATTAAALTTLLTAPTSTTTDASNRETGTVKPLTLAKSAGDKKVEVIK